MIEKGSEACVGCGFSLKLTEDNKTAWQIYQMVDQAGRDTTGTLRIEAVTSTTEAIGGSIEDLSKVLILEKTKQANFQRYGEKRSQSDTHR